MAKETAFSMFQGDDGKFVFTILNSAETTAIDIAGWTMSFMVKRYKSDADISALVSKTTAAGIVISGTFNATPSVNTQIATVTVDDTDTTGVPAGVFCYGLKRMDNNFETVLAYGPFELIQGVIR